MITYNYSTTNNTMRRRVVFNNRTVSESEVLIPLATLSEPNEENFDKAWLMSDSLPLPSSTRKTIRMVDLFCGCGGLTLGIREACRALGCGFESVYASDINESALNIYKDNFSPVIADSAPIETVVNADLGSPLTSEEKIFSQKLGKIDIIVAGPPCQGNSDLNNHTRRTDSRNLLYLRAVRCVEILSPNSVIIENVPGVAHDTHNVLSVAVEHLKKIGYKVDFGVIDMSLIGVAQKRKRMFLIASKLFQPSLSDILSTSKSETRNISWACDDLLGKTVLGDVFNSSANSSATNQRRIDYLFDHNLYELPNSERPDCHRLKPHRYEAVYGRMHWDQPSPTITGGFGSNGQGRFVHPLERRTLTPHEAARVQFFPDFFRFNNVKRRELQQIIGNAVPSKAGFVVSLQLLANDIWSNFDEQF